jgi:hypothetical protein
MLRRHTLASREQGTRRHNKTGVVERGNGMLKDFTMRLILDIQSQVAGSAAIVLTEQEIFIQATFPSICLWATRCFRPSNSAEGTNNPFAAYTDASLPRNVSLHITRWLHVLRYCARVVSGMSMCYHAVNWRRELIFLSISRTLSKRTSRGGTLVILLTRTTILQQSDEKGTAEAAD